MGYSFLFKYVFSNSLNPVPSLSGGQQFPTGFYKEPDKSYFKPIFSFHDMLYCIDFPDITGKIRKLHLFKDGKEKQVIDISTDLNTFYLRTLKGDKTVYCIWEGEKALHFYSFHY
jgi:hypothetical protein